MAQQERDGRADQRVHPRSDHEDTRTLWGSGLACTHGARCIAPPFAPTPPIRFSHTHFRLPALCSPSGHPLVYPHLATGVLFNDETDAWHGYTLAWNIYFWHGDIASYWTRVRREMEQRVGDLAEEEDDAAGEDGAAEERGRGKRKRRKLNVEKQHDDDAEGAEEQDEEAQLAAATAASIAEHKQQVKPAASSAAAAAAAAAMSPAAAAAAPGHKDAEERKTAETIEID